MKFKLNCYDNTHKRKEENILNYYRADYKTIKSRLGSIDWEAMLNGTIKADYPKFVEQLHLATVGCIPNRISSRKKKNMYMTTEALCQQNRKHLIHTKSAYDHSAFLRCKNSLRNLTKNFRAEYESDIVKKIKGKPKIFWRYVNSKLKTRERIPTLKNMDGTFSVSPREKAEALNQYFCSIFLDENLNDIPISPDVPSGEH